LLARQPRLPEMALAPRKFARGLVKRIILI
jgi:hypothetical protein